MPEDVRATTIKLILGLVRAFVWFLWLLASMGTCTQGSHVKVLCREPRFLFAMNLNIQHSPQVSVKLEEPQKGAIHQGCIWLPSQGQYLLVWAAPAYRPYLSKREGREKDKEE